MTLAVLLIAWTPVVIQQFRQTPGNLTELWDFFTRPDGSVSVQPAFRTWADMMTGALRPDFVLAYGDPLRRSRAWWPQGVAILELAGLTLLAALTRDRFQRSVAALLLGESLAALWSITRIRGTVLDHEVFWISGLGALTLGTLAGAAISLTRLRLHLTPRFYTAVCSLVLVLVCSRAFAERRSPLDSPDAAAIRATAAAIQDYVGSRRIERPLIVIDQAGWHWAAGTLLQLQKRGVAFAVERDWLPMFTDDVAPTGRETVAITIAGAGRHFFDRARAGNVVVAEHPPIYADAAALGQ